MDEPPLPRSPALLVSHLREVRDARRRQNVERRQSMSPVRRAPLTKAERATIFEKTAGRCHLCGGEILKHWDADHVLAHSSGGQHRADNYLPAHSLCNNYRWHYSPEEFQWVLKIGVWARTQMEKPTALGSWLLRAFHAYEVGRERRRRNVAAVAEATPTYRPKKPRRS